MGLEVLTQQARRESCWESICGSSLTTILVVQVRELHVVTKVSNLDVLVGVLNT